jgi:hypothetical protein
LFIALTGFFLSACEKLELGKEFIVRIGEDKKINSYLSFKVDSIWDSRCPIDMFCITSGDVTLFFNINHLLHHVNKVISFYGNRNHPFSYDGYLWKVLEVNPSPLSGETIDPKDITIKMVITKD